MKTFFFNSALRSKSPSDSSETPHSPQEHLFDKSKESSFDQDIEYMLALDDFQSSQNFQELGFNFLDRSESSTEFDFISEQYLNEIISGERQLPDDEEKYNIFLKKLKVSVLKNMIDVSLYYDSELIKDDKIFDILFFNSKLDEKEYQEVLKKPDLLKRPNYYRIFLKSLKKSVSDKLLNFTEDDLIWASEKVNEGYHEILEIMSGNHFMEKQQFTDIVKCKILIPQDLISYRIFLVKLKNSISSEKIVPTYNDLLWATKNGLYDILKILFSGLSYYEKIEKYVFDENQQTLLHHYVLNEYEIDLTTEMVELLIDNRVPLNLSDFRAKTALQYAISKDCYEIFIFLINRNFFNVTTSIRTLCTVSEGFKEKKNCLDSVIELIEGKYAGESEEQKKSVILKYTKPILSSGIFILNPINASSPTYQEMKTFLVRINFVSNFFNLLCADKTLHDKESRDYEILENIVINLLRNYFNAFIMLRLIDANEESFKNILTVYYPIEEAIEKVFPGQLFSQKIESPELREIILQAVKKSEINYTQFCDNPSIKTEEKLFFICPDLGIAINKTGSAYKVDEELDQEAIYISPLNYSIAKGKFFLALNLINVGFDTNQIDDKGYISMAFFIKSYVISYSDDIKELVLRSFVKDLVSQNFSIYSKLLNSATDNQIFGLNLSFCCFEFFAKYSKIIFSEEKNKKFTLLLDPNIDLGDDKFQDLKRIILFQYDKYFSLNQDFPLEIIFYQKKFNQKNSKLILELSLKLNEIFQKCKSPLRSSYLLRNVYFDQKLGREVCDNYVPEYVEGKYQGQMQRCVAHGEGIISFEGGLTCAGSFSNGFLNGFATFTKTYLATTKKKKDSLTLYFVNGICIYLRENKIYELAESPFLRIKYANFIASFKQFESKSFLSPSDEVYQYYLTERNLRLEESYDSTISSPIDYIEKIQENFFLLLISNFLVFKDFNDAKALLKSKSREVLLEAKAKQDYLLKLIKENQTKLDKLKSKGSSPKNSLHRKQSIEKIEKKLPFYLGLLDDVNKHIKQIKDYLISSAVDMSRSYRVKFLVNERDPLNGYYICESLYSAQKDLRKFLKLLVSNERNFVSPETSATIVLSSKFNEYFYSYLENPETKEIDKSKYILFLEGLTYYANIFTRFLIKFDLRKITEAEEINSTQILVEEISKGGLINFEEKLVELEQLQQDQQQTPEVQESHTRIEGIVKEFDDNLQKIKTKLANIDSEIDNIESIVKADIELTQYSQQKSVEKPSSYLNLFSRFLTNRSASVVLLADLDDYSEYLKNALLGIVKIKIRSKIHIDRMEVEDYDDFKVGSAYLISPLQINEFFDAVESDFFKNQKFLISLADYYKKETLRYIDKLKHYFHLKFEELLQRCLEEEFLRRPRESYGIIKEKFKRRIYNFLKFCHVKESLEIENLDADYYKNEGLGHATGASLDQLKKSIFLLNKLQNLTNQKISLTQFLIKLEDVVFNEKEDLQFSDKKERYREKVIELDDQSYLENLFMSLSSISKKKSEFEKISEEFKNEFVNFYLPFCFMLLEIYQIDRIAKEKDRCFMESDLKKIQKIEQLKLGELDDDKDSISFQILFEFLKENPEILKIINNFALTPNIKNIDSLEKIEIAHEVFAKFSSETESLDRYQVKNEDHYNAMRRVISSYFEEGYLMKISDFKRRNSSFLDRDRAPSVFKLEQGDKSLTAVSPSPALTRSELSVESQAKTTGRVEASSDLRSASWVGSELVSQGKEKRGKKGRGKVGQG